MNAMILGAAALLILVILVLLFRVQQLVAVARGSSKNKGGLTNKVNGAMFMVFFVLGTGAFIYYSAEGGYMLPESASIQGVLTDDLLIVSLVVISIVFIFTNGLLFYFSFKYQYKEGTKATYYPDNHVLELVWTVIPAIVLTYLVFNGYKEWAKITGDPSEKIQNESIQVEIVGQQFAWNVRYPGADGEFGEHYYRNINGFNEFGLILTDKNGMDDFKAPNKLVLPVDKRAHLKIRAKDVLHSVYAPHFRMKMDAVPGMPTQMAFTPTITTQEMRNKLGNQDFVYEIACTEICGRGHNSMRYIIEIVEQDEYEEWAKKQQPWSIANKKEIINQLEVDGAKESVVKDISDYIAVLDPSSAEVEAPAAPVVEVESDSTEAEDVEGTEGAEEVLEEVDSEVAEELTEAIEEIEE